MKFRIQISDLVCYKGNYAAHKGKTTYNLGLVTSMTKSSLGKELTILWNNGSMTETSVHLIRKITGSEDV